MAIFTLLATAITSAFFSIAGALGATLGTAGLALAGTIVGYAGAALIYGGISLSLSLAGKGGGGQSDFSSQSPSYANGMKQTQTNPDLPIPLIYGTVKVAGNRIWQDDNATSTVKRIVAFADGEITDFTDIRLNEIEANTISGIKIEKFYGTNEQGLPSMVNVDTVGSLKHLAYLAITVPRTDKIDLNYNLTTILKGRKIRVYASPSSYTVKYSENPAWVLFDFLTAYNGMGLCLKPDGTIDEALVKQMFDFESFIESAAFCDELVNGKPRFTFNMIFDAQTSARSLIDEIKRSCRGGLFTKGDKLQFKIDKAEPVSKVFNRNDIITGSETFQCIPQEENYEILKCVYISPEHEWQKVEAFAEIPEYRNGIPVEHSVNIFSCTNFEQASRLAWYYVNAKTLQPYFGSFQADYKAFDLEIGDVISIDSLLMGLENYQVKVTNIIDNGTGIFTVSWRHYDERLYTDELGSKEPKVIVSNLSDLYGFPDDVQNFNVVQKDNLFNFVWEYNQNSTVTYEIRVGLNWETGEIVGTGIKNNSYQAYINNKGLYSFWIKAFNKYNFSKNATMDIIYIESVPNLNEVVNINVLDNMGGEFENTYKYKNVLKLAPVDLWQNIDEPWVKDDFSSAFYQQNGVWGGLVEPTGTYTSQVYDIGGNLESVVNFKKEYFSLDEQADILIEWAYSTDGIEFTDWQIINFGSYTFRYFKFKITMRSYNQAHLFLNKLEVTVDVPDKELELEVEVEDMNGLLVEYDFIAKPSIVATVNDNIAAFAVAYDKTNKNALIKVFTNGFEPTVGRVNLRIKGY